MSTSALGVLFLLLGDGLMLLSPEGLARMGFPSCHLVQALPSKVYCVLLPLMVLAFLCSTLTFLNLPEQSKSRLFLMHLRHFVQKKCIPKILSMKQISLYINTNIFLVLTQVLNYLRHKGVKWKAARQMHPSGRQRKGLRLFSSGPAREDIE